MKPIILALAVAVSAVAAPPARAEVKAAEAGGFHLAGTVTIAAPPSEVWATLIQPDAWWSTDHRWFEGSRLTLDLTPGGCWCESGPDGAGAMHMRVGYVQPGQAIQLVGGLGPLQGMGLDGALRIDVKPEGEGARLNWSYVVVGWRPEGAAGMAAPVDGVLTEQMGRLKAAAER